LKAAPREGAAFFSGAMRVFGGARAKSSNTSFAYSTRQLWITVKRQNLPNEDYTKGHEIAIFGKNFYSNASFGRASSYEKASSRPWEYCNFLKLQKL